MKKIAYILAVLLTAACVYPYTPDLQESGSGNLVVEGDIIIGKVCSFNFSCIRPIGSNRFNMPVISGVWVEDGKGKTYPGRDVTVDNGYSAYTATTFTVDLTDAPQDGTYSLRFKDGDGNMYYSEPSSVKNACKITGMGHHFDDEYMYFTVSLSGAKGNNYKISWNEDWEYHAQYQATSKYIPPGNSLPASFRETGMMVPISMDESDFRCWGKASSKHILTVSTAGLESGDLADFNFLTMPVNSLKLSCIYAVEIVIRGISEDAMAYLENVEELSVPKPDLFTPTPSMVRGNIRNSLDEDELVIGYVGVGMETRQRHFADASADHRRYRYPAEEYDMKSGTFPSDWYELYMSGYLPLGGDDQMGYNWVPARCVDCTSNGGTKMKPDFWPDQDE